MPNIITITKEADKHLSKIIIDNDVKGVILSMDGGGCAGFSYKWNLAKEKTDDMEKQDLILLDKGFLYVDPMMTMYIMGTQIDFTKDIAGSYLKIVNPNATSECGCGESFSV